MEFVEYLLDYVVGDIMDVLRVGLSYGAIILLVCWFSAVLVAAGSRFYRGERDPLSQFKYDSSSASYACWLWGIICGGAVLAALCTSIFFFRSENARFDFLETVPLLLIAGPLLVIGILLHRRLREDMQIHG